MQRLADFFKRIESDTYPEPPTPGHTKIIEMMVPIVAKFLPKGAHMLDVGCGQGDAVRNFLGFCFDVTAITLNPEDYNIVLDGYGRSYDDETAPEASVYQIDQNNMPDKWTSSFHCVWARHVLEHSIMPYFTLHEFNRVLKPKGILYVEVPAPDTDCAHESNRNHYSVLGKRAWICLINRAGFEIEEARSFDFTTPAGPDTYWSFICRKN